MPNLTPGYKWLCEKRGRVAYSLAEAESAQVRAEDAVRAAKERAFRARQSVEGCRHLLESLDRLLVNENPSSDPTAIAPVAAWQGRYGARGQLRGRILHALTESFPVWLATDALQAHVASACGINVDDPAELTRWSRNSFKRAVKQLAEEGRIERGHPIKGTQATGQWRLASAVPRTLADLAALAALALGNDPV